MRKEPKTWTGIITGVCLIVLIIDAKTAFFGAKEGVTLCLNTVIPSLFPFLFLSSYINAYMIGKAIPALKPINRLCGIPDGCESVLLLGLLGGYPVGAKAVYDSYRFGNLPQNIAKRMLGFCNNAGPAFIFGMLSLSFSSPVIPWIIWTIQIVSALITGTILPGTRERSSCVPSGTPITFGKALENSVKTMALICGWVILFRVLICIGSHWILWMLTPVSNIMLMGIMDLTNGCCSLSVISSESLRFLLAVCFLSFGGLCILMQTVNVTNTLGLGLYMPGKVIQTLSAFILAGFIQRFLFPDDMHVPFFVLLLSGIAIAAIVFILKKTVEKQEKV